MADYDAFDSGAPSQLEKMLLNPVDMDSSVVSRTSVKFRPQAGIANNQSRTIQFRLSSSNYLDLSTLQFGCKMTRKFPNQIAEDCWLLSAISSLRVEVGGVTCEDIRSVNRCLKPLIYAGVDEAYLRGDLTQAGSYKYVPSHCGVFSANAEADSTHDTAVTGTTGNLHSFTSVGLLTGTPSTAEVATKVNDIIKQRTNSPFSVYLAHPAQDYGGKIVSGSSVTQASSSIKGMDLGLDSGVEGIYVPASANLSKSTNVTAHNNYSGATYLGKATRPNSMPIADGITNGHANSLTRDYMLPMKLIMGLCRISSYFPVRNVGSLLVEFQLSPYNEQFIHMYQLTNDSTGNVTQESEDGDAAAANALAMASSTEYAITSPYLQCDVVQVSDAVVARVDEMCSSSGGYSLPYESQSTQTTPWEFTEQLSLTYSRAFSRIKAVHVSFQSQEQASSLYLSKSDYYLGSRFKSMNLQVGSTNFPLVDIDSPSEAYSELQKSLSHLGTTKGSVVDRATWLGERQMFAENQYSIAGFLPDIRLANGGGAAAMRMATGLPTQAPSCALWGTPLERVLAQGSSTYGSGLSSRASGLQLTHNFTFKPWVDSDWRTNNDSLLDPKYLDCALGNSRMLAYTVFSIDGLIRIANDAVSCSL